MKIHQRKIVFIDENIPLLAASLKEYADVTTFSGRTLTNSELVSSQCEILFTRSQTKLNEDLLKNTKVMLAGTATSGTDHVDLEYLYKSGIQFIPSPGSNANSVAEYFVYSVLKWALENQFDLKRKIVGIIGFGNIGKIVAEYSQRLGMKVIINDPPLFDADYNFPEQFQYMELNEVIEKSDIITNHVPLNYNKKYPTFNLIDSYFINQIKPNSLFVHASRGKVVDEVSLKKRVINQEISLAIDVWQDEPNFDCELARMSILATPHIAGYSYEGKIRGSIILADKFEEYTKLKLDRSIFDEAMKYYQPLSKSKFKDHKLIFELLKQNRKLSSDSQNLLELCGSFNPKEGFDSLRKNYPKRHESL